MSSDDNTDLRDVAVTWEALEDAFENNAPEVHSYLNVDTGEVIRVVDGIAEPSMHARIVADPSYLRIDPVSSREQYRWMERYIATVEDSDFRQQLVQAIDGKGAFRRFKDVLMNFPLDRERWFTFRSGRLRIAMEGWLDAHGLRGVEREKWEVPTAADDVKPPPAEAATEQAPPVAPRPAPAPVQRVEPGAVARGRLSELVESLPVRELDMAVEFLEFLLERRPHPRRRPRGADESHEGSDDND